MARRLTLDEEILAVATTHEFFDKQSIIKRIGERVKMDGEKLDIYCSWIDNAIQENLAKGYLWPVEHPITNSFLGYMLSTNGMYKRNSILNEVLDKKVRFGP